MKLLIATGVYPPESGGPATYAKLLEERLPALGFEVSVLPFRTVRHLPKGIRHFAYFFKCLSAGRRAGALYALDTASVGLPAALAALLLCKKFLVRVPGDYAWEQARQRFNVSDELDAFQNKKYGWRVEMLRRVQRFVVRSAKAVVVPSEYMRAIVAGWGAKNVSRIYTSIETPRPVPVERPQGFFVVTIARPVPWKGLDGLRRVVAREKHWSLKIVDSLPYPEAMGWVKSADVFVLNSTYEGLSHALVEAMMLGTPVVATRVGGNPELIDDGVEGLLVPAKDDEALYTAIKNVEQNKERAQARAQAARVKTKNFSIDTTITQIAALLKKI
mgnify:CR=1 FL=1